MTISVDVKPEVRGDAFNHEEDYLVIGTGGDENMTRDDAIQAVIDATPDDVSGIIRANATIREWWPAPGKTIAVVTMQYGELTGGGGGVIGETEAVYEFRYQAPSEHIYRSLATRVYDITGLRADVTFCNMIKIPPHGDDGPEGIALPAGNTTNVWRFNTTAAFVDATYEALIESMMGAVNNDVFRGRPAGTMRFVECDSQVTSGNKLSLTWGFQFSPNRTGVVIPLVDGDDITVDIGGHELVWDYCKNKVKHPTLPITIWQPEFIVVEQVFPFADFGDLGF